MGSAKREPLDNIRWPLDCTSRECLPPPQVTDPWPPIQTHPSPASVGMTYRLHTIWHDTNLTRNPHPYLCLSRYGVTDLARAFCSSTVDGFAPHTHHVRKKSRQLCTAIVCSKKSAYLYRTAGESTCGLLVLRRPNNRCRSKRTFA